MPYKHLLFAVWACMSMAIPAQTVLYNGWDIREIARAEGPQAPSVAEPGPGGLMILGTASNPDARVRAAISRAGFQVIGFVPRRGFLVRAPETPTTADSIRRSGVKLEFAVPLWPEWKIHPALAEATVNTSIPAGESLSVVIYATRISKDLRAAIVATFPDEASLNKALVATFGAAKGHPEKPARR